MKRTIYYNADIITMEPELPRGDYLVEAEGRIEAVGVSDEEALRERYGSGAAFVDLKGQCVVPGLIDSHMHMLTGALTKLQADLNDREFESIADVLDFLKEKEPSHNGWLRAFGYDEARVGEKRLMTRADLDAAFPSRPVIVTRVCGHLSMVNSAALALLHEEVIRSVSDCGFHRDQEGRLTGIAVETAQQYVLDHIPAPGGEEIMDLMEAEQRYLLEKGICSIHDAGTDQMAVTEYVDLYREFNRSQRLKLRTYLMVRPVKEMEFCDFAAYVKELIGAYSPEDSRLFFGAVKLFADGSLGGRTAAIYGDYLGEPENHGMLLTEGLDCYIKPVHEAGLQLAVHAIGDRAAEYVADQMIDAMKGDGRRIRHRIEHAELQDDKMMQKLANHGLYVMTQPGFIGEFQDSYRKNLGEQEALRIQPLKTMGECGVHVGFGSDYPVMDPSPAYGIRCALTRMQKAGGQVLNGEERISFCEALKGYTVENAYGSYTETLQGSLRPGKFADFVVLDCSPEEAIFEAGNFVVKQTVVGGEVLYEKETGRKK